MGPVNVVVMFVAVLEKSKRSSRDVQTITQSTSAKTNFMNSRACNLFAEQGTSVPDTALDVA